MIGRRTPIGQENVLKDIFVSVIIPAYNEAKRLPDTLTQVEGFLSRQEYSAEVLVVENGSQDCTYAIAEEFSLSHPRFRAIHEEQRGKGLAVRRGMLEARGQYRFMCDADLSMPIAELNRFLPPALVNFDVAIASREAPGAIRYNEPAYRHFGGRFVNLIIRLLALPGLHDTQCGFKCFRAAVAEDLYRQQRMPGWSFDVEVLYLARKRGYQLVEIPVPWYYSSDSKVKAIQDTIRMTQDILEIRRNWRLGLYE